MQMTSFFFLAFVLLVMLALYWEERLLQQKSVRAQKLTLLAASGLFVACANVWYVLILTAQSFLTWFCAKDRRRVPIGVVVMILLLGVFKYTNFFLQSIFSLLGEKDTILLKFILPLGISFYTFSAVSYLVDVRRGKMTARSFTDVALYLSFFPKLCSGPIQRSQDFFSQLDRTRCIRWEAFSRGIQIFAFGLFKKLVLADRLSVFVDQVYETPLAFSSATVLLAVISYSLQIYFDFSGYSDMAIGAAKMMDIDLPENFNLPYLAHNVTEFWKRWHITLSSWLQEYLYFPLGGNRRGKIRTYVNLILTMVIGGIWHGASWNFVLWGLLHGLGLAVHKIWVKLTGSDHKEHPLLSRMISILITFAFTSFCWIFFRCESLEDALAVIRQLFSFRQGVSHPSFWAFVSLAVWSVSCILAAVKTTPPSGKTIKKNRSYVKGYYPLVDLRSFWGLTAFFVFCGLTLVLAYTGGSPFIYGAF